MRQTVWITLATALLCATAFATPSSSSDTCTRDPGTVTALGQEFYLDDRRSKGDGYWIYWETGEKPGFQRGGTFLFFDDPCARPHSDRAIFHAP